MMTLEEAYNHAKLQYGNMGLFQEDVSSMVHYIPDIKSDVPRIHQRIIAEAQKKRIQQGRANAYRLLCQDIPDTPPKIWPNLSWRIEYWLQNAGTTLLTTVGVRPCNRCGKFTFNFPGIEHLCLDCYDVVQPSRG